MAATLLHTLENFFNSTDSELRIQAGSSGIFSASDKKIVQNAIASATTKHKSSFTSSYVSEKDKEVLVLKRKQ